MRENLRKARRKSGMTQAQVAAILNIEVQSYQKIEYGTRIGRIESWDKLEEVFGISQKVLREDT